MFQHTAARRRLLFLVNRLNFIHCFNTQPPEGGCSPCERLFIFTYIVSTHSRPKAAAAKNFGVLLDFI